MTLVKLKEKKPTLFPHSSYQLCFGDMKKKNQIHEPFLKLFLIDILSVATYLDALIFMFDKNDFELGVLPTIQFLDYFKRFDSFSVSRISREKINLVDQMSLDRFCLNWT